MADNKRLLELALQGLEVERQRLTEEIVEVRERLNGAGTRQAPPQPQKARPARKGRITAAGRKRLSEFMKKRWAESRKAAAR